MNPTVAMPLLLLPLLHGVYYHYIITRHCVVMITVWTTNHIIFNERTYLNDLALIVQEVRGMIFNSIVTIVNKL